MTELPAPLVPAEVDLSGFDYMPLYIERLKMSKAWLACKRRPQLAFYLINLWTRAFQERPHGSIEDDDDVLADAAMCSPKQWEGLRETVLRGWQKCADGRLYHPFVAKVVLDSWAARIKHKGQTAAARAALEQKRLANATRPETEAATEPDTTAATASVTQTATTSVTDTATGLKRREEKVREEKKDSLAPNGAGALAAPDLEMEFDLWWLTYPRKQDRGHALKAFKRVRKSGITLETLTTAARKYAAERAGENAQFTKLGATWLNGQCWLDKPLAVASGSGPAAGSFADTFPGL